MDADDDNRPLIGETTGDISVIIEPTGDMNHSEDINLHHKSNNPNIPGETDSIGSFGGGATVAFRSSSMNDGMGIYLIFQSYCL